MALLQTSSQGVILSVQAQPKAGKNAIVGIHAGRLKVAVTEAPEQGKANKAIVKLLARSLGLKRSQIELTSGRTSAHKRFIIREIDEAELNRRIAQCLNEKTG